LFFRKGENVVYGVQLRQGPSAMGKEWKDAQIAIENLVEEVRKHPDNLKAKKELGFAYIQESRNSGNHTYYDVLAINLFDEILKKEKDNYEVMIGKATVLLSQHHFAEAIPIANDALRINPYSSAVYGILTDAYLENGDYATAIEMADHMVSLRPDIRSYSRVSYLREIYGDYSGAINAMKMAVEAGYPGLEQTEWCRTQLGKLYENTGNLLLASQMYNEALYFRSTYDPAYAGLARLEKAKGNYIQAIDYFKKAMSIRSDFSYQMELTDLYRISNQPVLASESAHKAIVLLSGASGNESNAVHGHYADRELALAYLDAYDYNKALKHALIEYNRRPANIDVNQTLAWVNFKLGRYKDAEKYSIVALKTGSLNPVLNFQAGLIFEKAGDVQKGKMYVNRALKISPYIDPLLKWEDVSFLTLL
jgi:tetratricopeptide (TPR) repeat protein